jgi:hypothetical protein
MCPPNSSGQPLSERDAYRRPTKAEHKTAGQSRRRAGEGIRTPDLPLTRRDRLCAMANRENAGWQRPERQVLSAQSSVVGTDRDDRSVHDHYQPRPTGPVRARASGARAACRQMVYVTEQHGRGSRTAAGRLAAPRVTTAAVRPGHATPTRIREDDHDRRTHGWQSGSPSSACWARQQRFRGGRQPPWAPL